MDFASKCMMHPKQKSACRIRNLQKRATTTKGSDLDVIRFPRREQLFLKNHTFYARNTRGARLGRPNNNIYQETITYNNNNNNNNNNHLHLPDFMRSPRHGLPTRCRFPRGLSKNLFLAGAVLTPRMWGVLTTQGGKTGCGFCQRAGDHPPPRGVWERHRVGNPLRGDHIESSLCM